MSLSFTQSEIKMPKQVHLICLPSSSPRHRGKRLLPSTLDIPHSIHDPHEKLDVSNLNPHSCHVLPCMQSYAIYSTQALTFLPPPQVFPENKAATTTTTTTTTGFPSNTSPGSRIASIPFPFNSAKRGKFWRSCHRNDGSWIVGSHLNF